MYIEQYPSKLLENAVREFSKLPGIGERTALRLVLYLLSQEKEFALTFSNAIKELRENVHYCKRCHNISENELCDICANPRRDESMVCVVENLRDVISIENTHQYNGLYHVLGGKISPMEGIGPGDLSIDALIDRVKTGVVKEIILALSTTMEGDTTNFYIYRKLQPYTLSITTLARGVAIGDELEYADEVTLGRSLVNRTLFDPGHQKK